MRRVPQQLEVERLLRTGCVFLHIDARIPDVVCPGHLVGKADLVLQVGYNMPNPIPDLHVNEYGVSGTLSFQGRPFECFVPWVAIYGVTPEAGTGKTFGDVPAAAKRTPAPVAKAGKVIQVDFKRKQRVG